MGPVPRSMWDLPGSEIEPVSPALAGGFFTAEPPGKPKTHWWLSRSIFLEWNPVVSWVESLLTPWHLIDFVRFCTNAKMCMVFNSNSSCVLVGGGRPVLKIAHDKPSGQGRYDMPCYLGTKARSLAQKRSLAYERDHPLYIENLIIVVHDYEASILLDSLFSPGFLVRQMVYSELKWKETNKQKNYNRLVGRGFIWHLSEFPYNLKLAFLPNWGLCKGAHWYEFCCKWGSYLGEGD